jgi:hypothetical protein
VSPGTTSGAVSSVSAADVASPSRLIIRSERDSRVEMVGCNGKREADSFKLEAQLGYRGAKGSMLNLVKQFLNFGSLSQGFLFIFIDRENFL